MGPLNPQAYFSKVYMDKKTFNRALSVLQHLLALFSAYLFYISQQFQELNSLYLSRITRLVVFFLKHLLTTKSKQNKTTISFLYTSSFSTFTVNQDLTIIMLYTEIER